MSRLITLEDYIIQNQADFPYATGELTRILNAIGVAAKIVNREVNKAGLGEDILGAMGTENVQGEAQQKLDVYANNTFIRCIESQGEVCGIASEENDEFIAFNSPLAKTGKYVVAMDPLDGSSNIDVNVSIGTIFSVYRRRSTAVPLSNDDFLQRGTRQVAAGYVIFGSSTMMVFTTGNGVNGFTLDPSIGEFCLSHADMRIPESGKIYSINEGNILETPQAVQDYVKYCQGRDNDSGKPYSARYIGSLVADFHRNLIKGGIYMYPQTASAPNGKLRLLYECNPLAFVAEQAGGAASTGTKRILELEPTELHERVPFFVGSKNMVEKVTSMIEAGVEA